MSHAPLSAENYDGDEAYEGSRGELYDQINRGVSWSGHEKNAVFLNLGRPSKPGNVPRFADVSSAVGFDFSDDARGVATVDWDHDGDLDVIVTNRTGPRLRLMQNTLDGRGRFLMLRLRGTGSNRDAIGARVEVTLRRAGNPVTLLRTVYAGHGFISQSSKWLHFGLDKESSIEKVVVRWPNGERELIDGVSANAHFTIAEGVGRAEGHQSGTSVLTLDASPQEPAPYSDAAAVRFTEPIPLPLIRYERAGAKRVLTPPHNKPILINLWATWCVPCLAELKDFTDNQARLDAARVQVLALNVDHLRNSSEPNGSKSDAFLQRINFPFDSGQAPPGLMRVFEIVHNEMFLRPRPMPMPLSVLIDQSGRMAAVYRGPVDIETLIKDVNALNANQPDAWLTHSRPFAGHWLNDPPTLRSLTIARSLLDEAMVREAAEFLMLHPDVFKREPDYADVLMVCGTRAVNQKNLQMAGALWKRAVEMRPTLAEAHNNLGVLDRRQGKFGSAAQRFRLALKQKPEYTEARLNLSLVLAENGHHADALRHVDMVLAEDANHLTALILAGNACIQLKNWTRAKAVLERVLAIQPNRENTLIHLGYTCVQLGETARAIECYQQALGQNPKLTSVRRALEALTIPSRPRRTFDLE